jgi:hypothetical protein
MDVDAVDFPAVEALQVEADFPVVEISWRRISRWWDGRTGQRN